MWVYQVSNFCQLRLRLDRTFEFFDVMYVMPCMQQIQVAFFHEREAQRTPSDSPRLSLYSLVVDHDL